MAGVPIWEPPKPALPKYNTIPDFYIQHKTCLSKPKWKKANASKEPNILRFSIYHQNHFIVTLPHNSYYHPHNSDPKKYTILIFMPPHKTQLSYSVSRLHTHMRWWRWQSKWGSWWWTWWWFESSWWCFQIRWWCTVLTFHNLIWFDEMLTKDLGRCCESTKCEALHRYKLSQWALVHAPI